MRITQQGTRPDWNMHFRCTNPWCMCGLDACEKDVEFGEYPDELNLNGEGFFMRCRSCKRAYALHRSMLYAPFVERKEADAIDVGNYDPHEGYWRR